MIRRAPRASILPYGARFRSGASDGDECEGAWGGASFHADHHGQPGVDVQESRAMEGGRRAGGASDGDECEGAWGGASFHADQHGQFGETMDPVSVLGGK